MADIINFIKFKPVTYSVHLTHYEDDFGVEVVGCDDDAESRRRVAEALRYAAGMIIDGIKYDTTR
jgi:hypothetical protein